MITIDKNSFFPLKWLAALQTKQTLPRSSQSPLHVALGPSQKATHPVQAALHGVQHRPSKPHSEIIGLYDSSQIENNLRKSGSLSSACALVGMCEDGLPFILDFSNPAPGSLLIAGDFGSGKKSLIDSLLASSARLSRPDEVKIFTVSEKLEPSPAGFEKQSMQASSLDFESFPALISTFADEISYRKKNPLNTPVHILVVYDLLALVARLDTETLSIFHKIIKHGPRNGLWTIAGLNSCDIPVLEPRILESFRTHLICSIQNKKLIHELSGSRKLNPRDLEFGSQFFIRYGEEWLKSWICQPQTDQRMEVGQ